MQTAEIEQRMRPGGWSARPLLLPTESLSNRLLHDARRLELLGTSAEALGGGLAALLGEAAGSDWFHPRPRGQFDVELRRRRGFITCPWAPEEYAFCPVGAGARASANEFLIVHRDSGRRLAGFEISAHLVRDHGFFGGEGTDFRIEPEDLAALLSGE